MAYFFQDPSSEKSLMRPEVEHKKQVLKLKLKIPKSKIGTSLPTEGKALLGKLLR